MPIYWCKHMYINVFKKYIQIICMYQYSYLYKRVFISTFLKLKEQVSSYKVYIHLYVLMSICTYTYKHTYMFTFIPLKMREKASWYKVSLLKKRNSLFVLEYGRKGFCGEVKIAKWCQSRNQGTILWWCNSTSCRLVYNLCSSITRTCYRKS
jgi:hypothetical protein